MRSIAARRWLLMTGALCALVGAGSPSAEGAIRSCSPVLNPYPGTRFADSHLRRIRASGLSCRSARRVARGAHRAALARMPPPSGVRRFRWNGWRVVGDLRGTTDRYLATRGARRVRWVFSS